MIWSGQPQWRRPESICNAPSSCSWFYGSIGTPTATQVIESIAMEPSPQVHVRGTLCTLSLCQAVLSTGPSSLVWWYEGLQDAIVTAQQGENSVECAYATSNTVHYAVCNLGDLRTEGMGALPNA